MSATTTILRKTDDSVAQWLTGVVTGQGQSVSQLLVGGVLSLIPGIGQAMDARDVILGIIALSKNPRAPMLWVDMVITLVGIVPGFGDALKVAFKFICAGHPLGRVLDAVSPHLRGNIEKWLRKMDWQDLSTQLTKKFKEIVSSLISTLNERIVKLAIGDDRVAHFNRLLQEIYDVSDDMILAAVSAIKTKTSKVLEQPKPKSTHTIVGLRPPSPASRSTATTQGKKRAQKQKRATNKHPEKISTDKTSAKQRKSNQDTPDAKGKKTNSSKKRSEEEQKKENEQWANGVLGEHLTDYYAYQQQKNLKISNRGLLFQERDNPHGQGLDHLWRRTGEGRAIKSKSPGTRPFIVGETKISTEGFFVSVPTEDGIINLLAEENEALPKSLKIWDEEKLLKDTPDFKAKTVKAKRTGKTKWLAGLSRNKKKGNQMSHKWICNCIDDEQFRTQEDKAELMGLARDFKESEFTSKVPWDRWVCLITGLQRTRHRKAKSNKGYSASPEAHPHQIQKPIIFIPFDILKE